MFHEYGFGNDGTDATRSCQSHQRDDHMEEQNEDVAHAAWYQTALTSGISAGLVIRHAHVLRTVHLTTVFVSDAGPSETTFVTISCEVNSTLTRKTISGGKSR